jgi:hypothetical protein
MEMELLLLITNHKFQFIHIREPTWKKIHVIFTLQCVVKGKTIDNLTLLQLFNPRC